MTLFHIAMDMNSAECDTGGTVYPSQICPHIFAGALSSDSLSFLQRVVDAHNGDWSSATCRECSSLENWICLKCGSVGGSRYACGHSEMHFLNSLSESSSSHCVALSMSDLSVWCYW